MSRFSILLLVLVFLFVASQSLGLSCGRFENEAASPALEPDWVVWSSAETKLLQGTQERIQRYRQGEALVIVVNSDGVPVNDAVVRVEMLKHDFLFGSNLFKPDSSEADTLDQRYRDAFLYLFNYVNLPFYWDYYEPTRGNYQEAKLKGWASWAKEHDLTTYGHAVLWAKSVPSWLPSDKQQIEMAIQERITSTVGAFSGLVDVWDVVNEPTLASRVDSVVGQWVKTVGSADATANTLKWARKAAPEATLLVNDFRTDDSYYYLLKEIRKRGGDFEAVGIQTHMHTGNYPLGQVWEICERFKKLGVPLQFTELTVLSGNLKTDTDWDSYHPGWDTTPDGENIQAAYTEAIYRVLFSHPSVQAITWWDFSDLGAWQGAPAGLLRKDMTLKPAYQRLAGLISGEWWTNTEIRTNLLGLAGFRGFYGQYHISAQKNGKRTEAVVHLERGERNIFKLKLSD